MKIQCVACFISFMMTTVLYGQFMPVTTTIKTPQGNVPITTYRYMPMHHYHGPGNPSAKYDFRIVLRNDSTFTDRTRINISEGADHTLTIKHKGKAQEIFPNDTKNISRLSANGRYLTGIAADSCWLFKAVTGKINGYSALAEEGIMYVIAIQEGEGGRILPMTKENLMPMVITNQKAVLLVRQK